MCFIKRHLEVSLRATEKFGRARTSVSAEDVAPFYDKLLETLTSNKYGYNFFVFPNRIFNCDETAMEFDAISKFVCAGPKICSWSLSWNARESFSTFASGSSLPHLFIYKSLSGEIPKYVTDGAEESTMFQSQRSWWMSKDIYLKWFQEHFLKFSSAE